MSARILILEDDREFASMLQQTMSANDFEGVVCLDPDEALLKMKEEAFDLLISDFLMPKQEGISFIQGLRRFDTDTPVIMISAYMTSDEIIRAAEVGVTRVLKKPFESGELMREINKLLKPALSRKKNKRSHPKSASDAFTFPRPLHYFAEGSDPSRQWIQSIWEAFEKGNPLFLSGESGFELELILAELSHWMNLDGKLVIDVEAADVLRSRTQSFLKSRLSKEDYAPIVVLQHLERLSRSQQKPFLQLLRDGMPLPSSNTRVYFVLPIEGNQLSFAEMAFDDELLEFIYSQMVKLPGLEGRFKDIAHYAVAQGMDESGNRMNFSPNAIRLLLNYDWPGNFEQLQEVIQRLRIELADKEITESDLLSYLEKGMDHPVDGNTPIILHDILLKEQNRFIENSQTDKKESIKEVLKKLGVEENEFSLEKLNQILIYPQLLKFGTSV